MSGRLDRDAFRADLRTRHVGRELIYKLSTTSTMDDARAAAEQGAPHGAVVVAEAQTAGRGRKQGRTWTSPAQLGLTFTIVVRPDAERAQRLSIVTAVAVANAVEQVAGLYPRIKWPNDLRIKGRKFVGILIEGEWQAKTPRFALVGVGINVNFDPGAHAAEIEQAATSLSLERGKPLRREAVLAAVLNSFERAYDGALTEHLFDGWRSRSETIGREVSVHHDSGQIVSGIAEDVAADGGLMVRDAEGILHTFHAGEVTLRGETLPAS
jgi:BirA family biotin operon repressor/biotin-[acetyl-CoA-carboxylase] ligase